MSKRLIFLSVLCAMIVGCNSGKVRTFPVEGKVLCNGEPLAGALVMFHPIEEIPEIVTPNASVQEDGTFRLTTYTSEDGAPAGDYVVTIYWVPPGGGAEEDRGLLSQSTETGPAIDPTGGRYKDKESSELRATVEPTENTLEPFVLESPQG